MEMHHPVIETDGGPWADHDMACPVCRKLKAILNLNTGIFEPCFACTEKGWRIRRPWYLRVRRWWGA